MSFWQSVKHSYRSPSKAIVLQGAQSTSTRMTYNTSSSPTNRERALIIILVYHPPSFPVKDFEEISLKIHTYVMSLPSPLPNIIFLGDFNLPEIN